MNVTEFPRFTASAKIFWDAIPEQVRKRLLANVWCVGCRGETTIVGYSANIQRGDLILNGKCKKCGGEVTRVIEGKHPNP